MFLYVFGCLCVFVDEDVVNEGFFGVGVEEEWFMMGYYWFGLEICRFKIGD